MQATRLNSHSFLIEELKELSTIIVSIMGIRSRFILPLGAMHLSDFISVKNEAGEKCNRNVVCSNTKWDPAERSMGNTATPQHSHCVPQRAKKALTDQFFAGAFKENQQWTTSKGQSVEFPVTL